MNLNAVYEQSATNCLMVVETCCVPRAGVVSMAFRGGEHTSAMLDWVEPKSKASALIIAMPA